MSNYKNTPYSKRIFVPQSGYLTLNAVLIISFILFSVTLSAGFEGLWSLSGALDYELKETSRALAESCLDQAIVAVIQRPNFKPKDHGETLIIGDYSCVILGVERSEENVTIKTLGQAGKSFTSLQAIFDERNLKIISIEELP